MFMLFEEMERHLHAGSQRKRVGRGNSIYSRHRSNSSGSNPRCTSRRATKLRISRPATSSYAAVWRETDYRWIARGICMALGASYTLDGGHQDRIHRSSESSLKCGSLRILVQSPRCSVQVRRVNLPCSQAL